MKIQKLNESLIDDLNGLPQEPGEKYNKSSIYDLVKEYQNILKQYSIGTVLTHNIDAGTEKFTKIEEGEYGFWEHLRMPWGVSQKTSEFDVARWLACRANITRGKIIQEKLNNMKIQKLNESNDSKYITDEIASKTNSQEIKDAIDKNNLSVLVRDNTWYTEKCPNGLGKALKDEMKKLYPDLKHMYGESTSIKTFGAKGKKLNEDSLSESVGSTFKVGDIINYSGLHGGNYTSKVIAIHPADDSEYEKNTLECETRWTNEDTGKQEVDTDNFEITTDNQGNECIVVWEYAGEKGYVYPPSAQHKTTSTETSIEDKVKQDAKEMYEMGVHFDSYEEFASFMKQNNEIPTKELYQLYVDTLHDIHNGKDKVNESIKESNATHCVYFTQDGKDQIEFEGTEDECNQYISDIQAEQDDEFCDEAPERFIKKLDESMKDYRFEVSCNDNPTKVVKLIWDEKDVEGAKEIAKKYYAQEHTTYADDRANKWVIEESLEENVQYGVHQFSTDSIIFRGTEEECGKYIDNNKNLWDDAEVYMMNPNDPHYKKDLDEASYGGAFDIEDSQFFTREDIDNFAEEVLNHINETFEEQFHISGAYITDGVIELEITNETLGDFSCNKAIDMRKVKEPWHLKRAYATDCAVDLINQIKEVSDMFESINESTTENAHSIEAGAKFGIASIINSLIVSEYAAIEEYNSAIATAQSEGFDNIVKVLTDIQAEENVHVGQLQELMKLVDPNAVKVEEGKSEGAEQLSDTFNDDDDVFDFFTSDDVEIGNEDDIDDDEVETFIKKVKESMEQKSVENSIDMDELEEEVIIESTEPWEDIYKSFKDIETQLKGDGEAITATIDKLYQDNKHNPDFKKAYDKWASNE